MSTANRKLQEKAAKIAYSALARTAVSVGDIDPSGLDEKSLASALAAWITSLPEEALAVVLDHRAVLLQEARRFERSRHEGLAALLYATWAEHSVNSAVRLLAERRKLSQKSLKSMLRDVPLRGKCTWLLELLNGQALAAPHVKRILDLSEERNAFAHYKWEGTNDADSEKHELRVRRILADFAPTVRYLQRYERRTIEKNVGRLLRRKSKPTAPAA